MYALKPDFSLKKSGPNGFLVDRRWIQPPPRQKARYFSTIPRMVRPPKHPKTPKNGQKRPFSPFSDPQIQISQKPQNIPKNAFSTEKTRNLTFRGPKSCRNGTKRESSDSEITPDYTPAHKSAKKAGVSVPQRAHFLHKKCQKVPPDTKALCFRVHFGCKNTSKPEHFS